MPLVLEILEDHSRVLCNDPCNPTLCWNAIISSLEMLMVLLKDTTSFGQRSRNIKKCVERICKLAADQFDNPLVTMPVIGSMLTLRDKNLGYTMDSLARLDPPVL